MKCLQLSTFLIFLQNKDSKHLSNTSKVTLASLEMVTSMMGRRKSSSQATKMSFYVLIFLQISIGELISYEIIFLPLKNKNLNPQNFITCC